MKEILIIGAGGHAMACIDVIEMEGIYKIKALVGLPEEVGTELLGYEVKYTDNDFLKLRSEYEAVCVALGQISNPLPRKEMFQRVKKLSFVVPRILSPTSYVSKHALIGEGSMVFHGAVINAGAKIGSNSIINSRSLLEHGVTVGDHTHISTGVLLNGSTSIGDATFIGSGTVVGQAVNIGDKVVVGMGSKVFKDLPSDSFYINETFK